MINIEKFISALKVAWVRRIVHNVEETWHKLLRRTYLLTYLGLLQLEHRPSTIPLQHTRFWAASHAPFQLSFWALSSASVSRLQLLQGRPLLRFPWGFQLRACRVMFAGGFLSVWPIQHTSSGGSVWPAVPALLVPTSQCCLFCLAIGSYASWMEILPHPEEYSGLVSLMLL